MANTLPPRPTMIFFGGALQILGAIGEWILGNTFPMCLFFTYGTFWIVAGTQLIPWFGVGVQYSTSGSNLREWLNLATTPQLVRRHRANRKKYPSLSQVFVN